MFSKYNYCKLCVKSLIGATPVNGNERSRAETKISQFTAVTVIKNKEDQTNGEENQQNRNKSEIEEKGQQGYISENEGSQHEAKPTNVNLNTNTHAAIVTTTNVAT